MESSLKKNIAIIPARGGSKLIPRKNIKPFLGKPIIGYSIQAALESGLFDTVMVSTDDEEIKLVAESFGASVPFFRSPESSNDHANIHEVLTEVLSEYANQSVFFQNCCCILATAPLVQDSRIKEAYYLMEKAQSEGVVLMTPFTYPIQRALAVKEERIHMVLPENLYVRSNDLEPRYHDAGQFFWVKTSFLDQGKSLFSGYGVPLIVSPNEVQDIDTEEDWVLAETKFQLRLKSSIY